METFNHLLERVAQKDHHAFQQLYRETSPKLYAICLSIFRNDKQVAEEVLQESFIKIWKSAGGFCANKGNAMTWMSSVTRNHAIDHIRYNQRRPQFQEEKEYETLDYAANDYQPDQQHTVAEVTQRILTLLDTLPPKHKECVLQSFYYGYSHSEIAQKMSLPLGTVKAWIRRSLVMIRSEMSDEEFVL